MAARLRALPLIILAGCTTPAEEASHALQAAVASSRRNLAMLSGLEPAAGPAPPMLQAGLAAHPPVTQVAPGAGGALAPVLSPLAHAPANGPASAAQLLGARPETLRRWLGEPRLRRAEGNAEIWLYAAGSCALDLVLYREGGALRVAHAAARASGAEPSTEDGCLRALAAGGRSQALPAGTLADPSGA